MYRRLTIFSKQSLSQCIYFLLIIFFVFISINCAFSFPIDDGTNGGITSLVLLEDKSNIPQNESHSLINLNYLSSSYKPNLTVYNESGSRLSVEKKSSRVGFSRGHGLVGSRRRRDLVARHEKLRHLRHYQHEASSRRFTGHISVELVEPQKMPPRLDAGIAGVVAERHATASDHFVDVSRRAARATNPQRGASTTVTPGRSQFCPGQDVATRAYSAPTVFEGKVRSMSSNKKPHYAVTFEVKVVYKNQLRFKPLVKNETIRLQFAHGRGTNCECLETISNAPPAPGGTSCNSNGLVRAHLRPGKTYILFVNRVGTHNYTVLGPPVASTNKSVHAVQRVVIHSNSVKPANVSELSDVTVRQGKKLKLVCRTQGFPPPRVIWLKNGTDLFLRYRRVRVQYRRRQSILTISKVKAEDAGRYECTARGVLGPPVTKSAFVRVTNTTATKPTTLDTNYPHPCSEDRAQICMNGGTCMFFSSIGEYACQCANGFNGRRCDQKMPLMTKTEDKMLIYPPTRLIPGL